MSFKFLFTFSILLVISQTVAQDIVINEFMSTNMTTIADEDGDFSDWIEIYNRGEQRIDLTGFALTDNKTNLRKWVFPHLYLNPKSFLLVFASGKNKEDITINSVPYWDSVIQVGDHWKYLRRIQSHQESGVNPHLMIHYGIRALQVLDMEMAMIQP